MAIVNLMVPLCSARPVNCVGRNRKFLGRITPPGRKHAVVSSTRAHCPLPNFPGML
jgi:hypothetical protein